MRLALPATGKEVAVYCATHIPSMLASSPGLGAGEYGRALQEVFMECDRALLTEEAVHEMQQILKGRDDTDSDPRYVCTITHCQP